MDYLINISGILRDKTIGEKIINIHNDDKKNYPSLD